MALRNVGTIATGARIIALSVFASAYTWWVFLVCFAHWIVMAAWLYYDMESTRQGKLFIYALVYVFTFYNVTDDKTRWRYAFYYTVSTIILTVITKNDLKLILQY